MNENDFSDLRAALEKIIGLLEEPMRLVSNCNNKEFKNLIGELSADIIGKIDHEIFPAIKRMENKE